MDAVGGFTGGGPFPIDLLGGPDADVGMSLFCATEPSGDEAGGGFCEGGGMDLRVGTGFVDELSQLDGFGCLGRGKNEHCEACDGGSGEGEGEGRHGGVLSRRGA